MSSREVRSCNRDIVCLGQIAIGLKIDTILLKCTMFSDAVDTVDCRYHINNAQS